MAYFDHSTWLKSQGGGGGGDRPPNDPPPRNDLPPQNAPNQHRNDTGGHHQNDPLYIGNGIKRTTKTRQQFSGCFLFIYIASFLRCVFFLLTHFILQ